MNFAADGIATVDLPRGKRHSGRWTAEADGHFHTDCNGHHEDTVARVAGDTLTIARPDGAVTLTRIE